MSSLSSSAAAAAAAAAAASSSVSSIGLAEYYFGIPLSTNRDRHIDDGAGASGVDGGGLFPYSLLISAIAILFFRTTIYQRTEPRLLRWFFAILLAFLVYSDRSYELICSVEIFSYAVPYVLLVVDVPSTLVRLGLVGLSGIMSLVVCHLTSSGTLWNALQVITPSSIVDGLALLFPLHEIQAAYNIIDEFVLEEGLLQSQVSRLFFITFHIQVGMGYIGIDFLKKEQERRNQLVRMDLGTTTSADGEESSGTSSSDEKNEKQSSKNTTMMMKRAHRFQKSAAPFIFFTAVPYMVQIIGYGNLNAFAYECFKDDVHRAVRLYDLFDHDNYLVALAEHSAKSPADFAGYMDTVVSTSYDLFNRKIFSLPKVVLLPVVMGRQPKLVAQIFPIIFFSDWLKGRAVSYMTNRIEQLERETQELTAIRSKVEQFDMKNAELLQRAGRGATDFTRKRWQDLTVQVQMKTVVKDLTARTKMFFAWIQRNFVFSVLVDCALAQLIAVGKLLSADIFVFSRAIEDAVDLVLMRSRSEAELARMMTQIDNLKELSQVWGEAHERSLLPCNVAPPEVTEHAVEAHSSLIVLRNLLYSRGTAVVRVDHLELQAGVYAVTGANGSGKSTLFRVLMSCNTNDRPIDLPPSIVLSTPFEPLIEADDIEREVSCEDADLQVETASDDVSEDESVDRKLDANEHHPRLSITMPSSHVMEISQTFYWPLYSKPIDWIYQEHISDSLDESELKERSRRVAELLHGLEFTQSLLGVDAPEGDDEASTDMIDSTGEAVVSAPTGDAIAKIMDELVEEKEDWFSDLSGGQRSKVELVRQVLLHDECPHVLLIDETMAPLDPRSKSLVMGQIKSFCAGSVVLVIYHTDVGREHDDASKGTVECVPSQDFFDGNLHVENQTMQLRPVC